MSVIKILIIPDSFKNCLPAEKVAALIYNAIQKFNPKYEVVSIPFADGGEGTLSILNSSIPSKLIYLNSFNPFLDPINSKYLIAEDNSSAFIEMAQCSGIQLIKKENLNPLKTSSFGTGIQIDDAVKKGVKNIVITVGGTATNDFAIGALAALGIKFYSGSRLLTKPMCDDLDKVSKIKYMEVQKNYKNVSFKILTDVNNPLLGDNGATYTFGPQKGADNEMLNLIEKKMEAFNELIKSELGLDFSDVPMTGAAGGFPAGIKAFFNTEIVSGSEYLIKLLGVEKLISESDLVITGEGKIDCQSEKGKAPYSIAKLAKKYNKEVVAFTGQINNFENQKNIFDDIIEISDKNRSIEYSIKNAEILLDQAVTNYFERKDK